ncbi:hypothetical protein [Dactylosporangium sp. NPDC000521]|uniref:hypothetical protein n=1 Tax=Dactylosporangium sp. NPDC000521 TaxID=3363975 RepID=UPI0036A918C5
MAIVTSGLAGHVRRMAAVTEDDSDRLTTRYYDLLLLVCDFGHSNALLDYVRHRADADWRIR